MAKTYATPWHRYKYLLSSLVLILPVIFLYQSLNPIFPDALSEQSIGEYTVVPMPFDLEPAYQHDGVYVKDFLLTFKHGKISNIRQAFLNIGEVPIAMDQVKTTSAEEGFLHGNRHGQHVHALAKQDITMNDSIWLTIENWDGEVLTARWNLPEAMF